MDTRPDEARIRSYLLAELAEEERERLETEFFRDDAFFDRVRALEDDLIDDYVAGALSDQARHRFRTFFLTSPDRRHRVNLARALQESMIVADQPAREARTSVLHSIAALLGFGPTTLRFALVAVPALVVLLGVLIGSWEWARYRRLETQVATLTGSVDTLTQQNQTLRDRVAQLDSVNARLTQQASQPPPRVALQDTSGPATLTSDRTVGLATLGVLPPAVSQSVSELVTTGSATLAQPVEPALAALEAERTRGVLRSERGSGPAKPVPLSPMLTAIRSGRPTLRWRPAPGAQEYKVLVTGKDLTEVWRTTAGTETQVTVPPGLLKAGQAYFWQVEALVGGDSSLAPTVGFWVMDEQTLRGVEATERTYQGSALVLAATYSAHGLFEEALTQVERLAQLNPGNTEVQGMINRLRRQLAR